MRLMQMMVSTLALPFLFVGFASNAIAAPKVNWMKAADGIVCAQVGADGSYQHTVDDSYCIKGVGAKVEWKSAAEGVVCAEETPAGDFLQIIDNSYCVDRLGVKNAWVNSAQGVVCGQVTPQGGVIQIVDSSQCSGDPVVAPPAPTATPTPTPIPPAPAATPSLPNGPLAPPQAPAPVIVQIPQTPGYHWTDSSKTMCILYSDQGVVEHMAPPSLCRGT